MKKLITFMMLLGTMMFAIVAQAQVTYTATFSAGDLALESVSAADGNTYTKVTLSGIYGTIPEEGEPSLPTRQVNLMLPFGQTVDTIVLTNVVTTSFNVANHVFPALHLMFSIKGRHVFWKMWKSSFTLLQITISLKVGSIMWIQIWKIVLPPGCSFMKERYRVVFLNLVFLGMR